MDYVEKCQAEIILFLEKPKKINRVIRKFKGTLKETHIKNFIEGNLNVRFIKDSKDRYKSTDEVVLEAKRFLKPFKTKIDYWKYVYGAATLVLAGFALYQNNEIRSYDEDFKILDNKVRLLIQKQEQNTESTYQIIEIDSSSIEVK